MKLFPREDSSGFVSVSVQFHTQICFICRRLFKHCLIQSLLDFFFIIFVLALISSIIRFSVNANCSPGFGLWSCSEQSYILDFLKKNKKGFFFFWWFCYKPFQSYLQRGTGCFIFTTTSQEIAILTLCIEIRDLQCIGGNWRELNFPTEIHGANVFVSLQ